MLARLYCQQVALAWWFSKWLRFTKHLQPLSYQTCSFRVAKSKTGITYPIYRKTVS